MKVGKWKNGFLIIGYIERQKTYSKIYDCTRHP